MNYKVIKVTTYSQMICDYVFEKIKYEKDLSFKTKKQVKEAIFNGNSLLLYYGKQLVGFVMSENVCHDWYELGSMYIENEHRSKGLSILLLNNLVSDINKSYYFYTFHDFIKKIMSERYNFTTGRINDLPFCARFGLIKRRLNLIRIIGILFKSTKNAPILMIRRKEVLK